jgi:glycosyltransferase involved in cell wall biosynthesis
MCKPLISVIIPVYNTLDYIQRGIDSVLNQTYENIELVVVNDGSTDGSENLLDKVSLNNPKVTVFHQNNSGVSAARNKGLDLIQGEYVCFLDSDDWLTKDAIEFLYEQIKNKENTVSACDRNFVYINNGEFIVKRQREVQPIQYISSEKALLETGTGNLNLQSACYKLFPVSLINQNNRIRFDEDISHGEDGLFVFNVMNRAKGIVFSAEPKWNVLERHNSATNSGYSSKMLTALTAVDNMIYNSNSIKLQDQLKIYYTIRAIGLIIVYSTSKYKENNDKKILRDALIKYKSTFINDNVSNVDKVKYYFCLYTPIKCINLIYRLYRLNRDWRKYEKSFTICMY